MPINKIHIVSPDVFTLEELKQYEQRILDNKDLTEQKASKFFSEFPKFLTVGGYVEIAREVVLYKGAGEPIYRIDFCRRKLGEKFWDFVELKPPKVPYIVKRGSHWKFSSDIESGIHQAQDYRDFLEMDMHRIEFERRTGIKAFRPKILLVGGRRNNEIDPIVLKKLIDRYIHIDIQTYDDLYAVASEAYKTTLILIPLPQACDIIPALTGEEMKKLSDNWEQSFWYWRDSFGYGDSVQAESDRLHKNLEKLRDHLILGNPTTPRKIRSFALDWGAWTEELEEIVVRFERKIGANFKKPDKLDYTEYLEY